MSRSPDAEILSLLTKLYGEKVGGEITTFLLKRLSEFSLSKPTLQTRSGQNDLTERDVVLITYGDIVNDPGRAPLQSLAQFAREHLKDSISALHILPFYPWSSDDGFSVIDYKQVDPGLGDWSDIDKLSQNYLLMFDAVINHVSVQNTWFQRFLQGDHYYSGFFIVPDKEWDCSRVIRPRTSPLLTPFDTASGVQNVWTTFSADQVDLNFKNPSVLIEIIEILLDYIQHRAALIRLDAVAFIWKQSGTTCLHQPQVHWIVQLFRVILDWLAPWVKIITETNVPHQDNIAYFGSGDNEADLVYNFALPPLVLHTFRTGESQILSSWTASLDLPTDQVTFFNFLASHDGIGLNPVRSLISATDINFLVQQTIDHSGLVSYKQDPDGNITPYELNISFFDALNNPKQNESLQTQISRFICAHAIMLSLVGIPGIYFHSIVGSRSWLEGPSLTGQNRTINRQKLPRAELEAELLFAGTRWNLTFTAITHMLKVRAASKAFNPYGEQRVLECGASIFGLVRSARDPGVKPVICLHNVSSEVAHTAINMDGFGFHLKQAINLIDLLSGNHIQVQTNKSIALEPYQSVWLTPEYDPFKVGGIHAQ